MLGTVGYLAAKLTKSDQRKLLKALKDTGRVKVKDIESIKTAKRGAAAASLPDSLFDGGVDWRVVAASKIVELRAIVVGRDGALTSKIDELEKFIKIVR